MNNAAYCHSIEYHITQNGKLQYNLIQLLKAINYFYDFTSTPVAASQKHERRSEVFLGY